LIIGHSTRTGLRVSPLRTGKIPSKAHLIGHSIGGAIAIKIAASMPSLVSSLIVVDSTGIPLGSLPEVVLRRSIEMPAQIGAIKFKPLTQMLVSSLHNL
jgi:pimeloyl-ACP methyl ester carboxylesterase